MKLEFVIEKPLLKAANLFVAKNDVRYYLNGVLVELAPTGVYLVATNGHKMFVAQVSAHGEGYDLSHEPVTCIVDSAVVKTALTATGREELMQFNFDEEEGKGNLAGVNFAPIDAKYPDWRSVIPESLSGEVGQFDPMYTGDFAKAAKTLKVESNSVQIHHNGTGAGIVTFGSRENCFGILMPCRGSELDAVALARKASGIKTKSKKRS